MGTVVEWVHVFVNGCLHACAGVAGTELVGAGVFGGVADGPQSVVGCVSCFSMHGNDCFPLFLARCCTEVLVALCVLLLRHFLS